MPEERPSIARARDELREEHERLHVLLGRLRATPEREALAELLRELSHRLREHFRREEQPGGLYDAMGVSIPEARGQVGQLVDDHFRLASMARNLAEEALSPSVGTTALQEQAKRVADYLLDHEQREHSLVRRLVEGA
jgi:Hemerythrin HHE cation binding domain